MVRAAAIIAAIELIRMSRFGHMGQLMGENALELVEVEDLEDPCGHRHRCLLRRAAGGEGIGLWRLDHVDRRHRHPLLLGEPTNDGIDLGQLLLGDRSGPAGGKRHLVGEEVGEEVEADGDGEAEPIAASNGGAPRSTGAWS